MSKQHAIDQLRSYSNKTAHFYTSSVILDNRNCRYYEHTDKTIIHFGKISTVMAQAYIKHDNPLDCAGSFKAECAGILLFKAIETRDPTALIGLPLILKKKKRMARVLAKRAANQPANDEDEFEDFFN